MVQLPRDIMEVFSDKIFVFQEFDIPHHLAFAVMGIENCLCQEEEVLLQALGYFAVHHRCGKLKAAVLLPTFFENSYQFNRSSASVVSSNDDTDMRCHQNSAD